MLGEDEESERTAWEAYGACFHVRTLMGREIKVDAERDETVAALKRKLEQQEGIPSVRMRLSYLDILLKDQCTLGFYEIEKTHPIQMVLTDIATAAAVDFAAEAPVSGSLALEEPQEPPPMRSRASSEAIEVLTPDVDAVATVATVAAPAAAEAQAGAPAKDEGVPLCYKPSCVVS